MNRNIAGYTAFIFFLLLSGCGINRGLYSPSIDGLQSVCKKGQTLHTVTYLDAPGRYVAYSPWKHVAMFGDFKLRQLNPSGTAGIGFYWSKYKAVQEFNAHGISENTEIGFHADVYGGYGWTKGFELVNDQPLISSFFNPDQSEINYLSERYFLQTGLHFKTRRFHIDGVYRYNLMDIESIKVKPSSDNIFGYIDFLREKDPIPVPEIAFMVTAGTSSLKHFIGFNIAIPVSGYSSQLNYSQFNSFTLGSTYLISTADQKSSGRRRRK